MERATKLAGKAGVSVAFDLASFEVVRAFRPQITALLESGAVACCFCNEVGRGGLSLCGLPCCLLHVLCLLVGWLAHAWLSE